MPSPFPGMESILECQAWDDFRHCLLTQISNILIPAVVPRYVVRIEVRVYVERCAEPEPEEVHEAHLVPRERKTMRVVTAIELLSPTNKRLGSDGRHEYLRKRREVLDSNAQLIELDLLRGGERLPTVEPLPPGDYFAFVCRAQERPQAVVYSWTLRETLPPIPVPLAGDDPDVALDLQAAFSSVYDRAMYAYTLDYSDPVEPALNVEDSAWVREILENKDGQEAVAGPLANSSPAENNSPPGERIPNA